MTRTIRLPLSAPSDGRRMLRSARLVKSTDLPANKNACYRFRFGVMRAATFTVLASFDGLKDQLEAGVPYDLAVPLDRPLMEGEVLALEADRAGTPPSLADAVVEWTTTFRTALAGADVDQRLAQFFSRSGVLDRPETRSLAGLFPLPAFATGISHTASAQTITAGGAYENGTVSVTVTLPSWASIAYVSVTANLSLLGITATGNTFLAIGNGTVELTGEQYHSQLTTHRTGPSLTYCGTITAPTTFRIRVKADTNNSSIIRQTISYFAAYA